MRLAVAVLGPSSLCSLSVLFPREACMPPVEPRLAVEIIAQALRRRQTGRPVYDLRGDASMVLDGLREAGLAILAVPRKRPIRTVDGRARPPRDAEELAALIADALDSSLLAGSWDARVAAEAVLDAFRAAGLRVKIDRVPPTGPHLVFSRE